MRLEHLKLWDFRNYERVSAQFPPGIIVLTGPNGAGKSNLLEAVHYLSYLKSFRQARDRDVIRHQKQFGAVEANLVDDAGRKFDVRLVIKSGQRHVQFNGDNVAKFQDFIGKLHSQFFFPGNLALISGDPSMRREVLDLELLRLKPGLIPVYQRFRNALKERNKLLKLLHPRPGETARNATSLQTALAAFTEELVLAGSQVMRERRGLVTVLDGLFGPLYSELAPKGAETVSLAYNSTVELLPDDEVQANFRNKLEQAANSEAQLRYTTVGPQRDDLTFLMDGGRDLRRFGSQGQMRSTALVFRLALCTLSAQRISDQPILLLDDALSEMDDERKERLLGICAKHPQVFITSASRREVELIRPLATSVFAVGDGKLELA